MTRPDFFFKSPFNYFSKNLLSFLILHRERERERQRERERERERETERERSKFHFFLLISSYFMHIM